MKFEDEQKGMIVKWLLVLSLKFAFLEASETPAKSKSDTKNTETSPLKKMKSNAKGEIDSVT